MTRTVMVVSVVLVFVAALLGWPVASASPATGTVVRTAAGALAGVRDGGVVRWQGVPYAAPPVHALRWAPPRPAAPWTGVRDATAPAPRCAQGPGVTGTSEDCLYLNVTAPAAAGGRLPVLVWLHGGGLTQGSGSDYDPARLARRGIVVVTVDFRLGIYGFFGHAGLPGSGTFGLLDQQAALRWVRANIAAFGGDPGTVTLAGQSGGAIGTCAQLLSPGSAGLFQRAVLESGSCLMDWPAGAITANGPAGSFFKPLNTVEVTGATAATALGCPPPTDQPGGDAAVLECLRGLSPEALDGQYSSFAVLASGTAALPLAPGAALAAGRFHRVPVLAGHTRDEHRLVAGILELEGIPVTADRYPALLAAAFGAGAPAVLARYPLGDYAGDARLAWASVFTDRVWACTQLRAENALAARTRVFTYDFADEHAQPFADLPPDLPTGASHASELPNLFEVAGRQPITSGYYSDAQRRLAGTMLDYWAAFARTGNPNTHGDPAWPAARPGAAESPALRLAPDAITPIDAAATHQCAFWSTVTS